MHITIIKKHANAYSSLTSQSTIFHPIRMRLGAIFWHASTDPAPG